MAAPLDIMRPSGPLVEDTYIIKLKADGAKHAHLNHVRGHLPTLGGLATVTHANWHSSVFHGYAGKS